MRRSPFVLLLLVSLAAPATAQPTPDPVKYWIFFTDKQDIAGKAAVVPVTAEAVARRVLRGATLRPVDLDREVSPRYLARLDEFGIEPIVRSRWLNAVSAWLDPGELEAVRSLPFVRDIRPVGIARPLEEAAPPFAPTHPEFSPAVVASEYPLRFDYGTSITQMTIAGAVNPVEAGYSGKGVLLGIIDTGWGPALTHPSVKPIVDGGRLVADMDFTGKPDDLDRHALSVLSMAAGFEQGALIGPAYGASILHARTEYVTTETNQEEDHFVEGLEWMESQGVDVVNVSLGYSEFDPGQHSYAYADMDGDTAVTTRAADLAVALGVLMVASAGNEGNRPWFYITSPADGDSVLTVGAVNAQRQKSGFSSFGPTFDGRIKPDVSAMGQGTTVAVQSAGNNGYTIFGNGTSFASPMVAGIAALLLEADPSLTPMRIHEVLKQTASRSNSPNNELGWGIVNAEAALSVVTSREALEVPAQLVVSAWPNPFVDSFDVMASLPDGTVEARLEVFDNLGRRLAVHDAPVLPGPSWRFRVAGAELPTGVLHFRLRSGHRVVTGSIVHTK